MCMLTLELPRPWFPYMENKRRRHDPFGLLNITLQIFLVGCYVYGLVYQIWTVGALGDPSPSASRLWISCPWLNGQEPMDCCHHLQLSSLGRKERWKAKPSYSCQWTQVSAHRWPVAADKPGCQQWWILAPLDAMWHLPDMKDQAGTLRKDTGWHHLGAALLYSPVLLTPIKTPSSRPCRQLFL